MYRTKRDVYLSRDGRAVLRGDPAAMTLLFPANLDIPERAAERYGLRALEGSQEATQEAFSATTEEKALAGPPATKAREGPQTTKGSGRARSHGEAG